MTSGPTEDAQGRLRRLNLDIVFGSVSAVGALLIAVDAEHWQDALLMGAGLAAILFLLNRWRAGRFSRVAMPGLALTAAVWTLGVLAFDAATSAYGFAVVACLTAFELPRRRRAVITVTAAFAVAVLIVKPLVPAGPGGETFGGMVQFVFASLSVAVAGVVLTILAQTVEELIGELDRARQRESEIAVMCERVRFAGDLHDIQGHTLHVVKLKVVLAKKLLHSNLDRVERELDEVHTLVGDTITETKELAHARRRLNLATELENAKNLLEAAGIRVHVDREGGTDTGESELLGQVLRETTTNILRHTEAEEVWITLTRDGLSVANDGARGDRLPTLSGLAGLRERLAGHGAELTVEQDGPRFRTAATLPRPDTDAASATRKEDR